MKFKGKEGKEISKQVCLGSKQTFLLTAKKKFSFEGQYFDSSGRGSEGALLFQGYFLIEGKYECGKLKLPSFIALIMAPMKGLIFYCIFISSSHKSLIHVVLSSSRS